MLFRIRALVKRELAFEGIQGKDDLFENMFAQGMNVDLESLVGCSRGYIARGKKQEDKVRKSPASRILNKDQRIGSGMLMEDVRGTRAGSQ